ncbi:MAG: FAD-binding protein [Myxococcota bacterium]|nr:FAD-binding protein [Myxococcota bacterium]
MSEPSAPTSALRPGSAEQVSEILRESSGLRRTLWIRGGGTRLGIANPAPPPDAWLDLRDLRGVFELDAEEGVAHVAAGTSLNLVAAEAHAAGFELPLDPPGPTSTLGGCLAAAAVGPRFPRPRDAVLGLGVALATGEISHCGGRVVKNVTGYDVAKLHVGGFGSLGVIVSAWLRLRPLPERVLVLARKDETLERVLAVSRLSTARAAAFEDGALVLELAGDAAAVEADRERLPDLEEWGDGALEAVRSAQEAPARVRTRVASLPTRIVDASVPLRDAGARILCYPGSGLLLACFDREEGALEATRQSARIGGGPFRVEQAPDDLLENVDVFGDLSEQLPLHRALKDRFDPARILNPGRFVGGL